MLDLSLLAAASNKTWESELPQNLFCLKLPVLTAAISRQTSGGSSQQPTNRTNPYLLRTGPLINVLIFKKEQKEKWFRSEILEKVFNIC